MNIDFEKEQQASKLRGSLLEFTKFFYLYITGREFIVSNPAGRESHQITICKAYTKLFREQKEAHGLLLNLPPGYGKPLCKLTKVLTSDGERKSLGDLVVGDRILTHKGRFRKVNRLFPQGELPTIKIATFSGREIVTAYDHSFLTANGWVQAKDLIIGDCLGVAIPRRDFGKPFDTEQARLMGYFIGDGQVAHKHSNITACDDLITKDIQYCCDKLGFICNIKSYDLSNRPAHHNQKLVKIHISNGSRDWLIREGLAGKNSYTKRVPQSIMLGDFEAIKHFLGAYFACDGTFCKKAPGRRDFSCSISSVSKQLLEDCQHLFVRLGIRTRIRKKVRNQKTAKQGDRYTSYNLELSSQDDIYHFARLIGDKIHHNKARILKDYVFLRQRFDSNMHPDHIVSIEENGLVDCMCIEVEEDHTFTANDIVVHNSVLTSMFVAWSFAHYPDCNFLYISYSHDLASRHTAFIKQIMSSHLYKYLFDVELRHDSKAKDNFMTTAGGTVGAFGAQGSITGMNAGIPGQSRWSGCVLIDDAHKPSEVFSDTLRASVINNYQETILQRPRDARVPIVFIGQRLHEDDLAAYLMSGKDVRKWETVILKGIDDAGNALYPEAQPLSYLLELKEKAPFVFSSQIQQEPIPAGGALFKTENFVILDDEPDILVTFITADTASSSKDYNDATAFSFWGLYKLDDGETLALHCLDNWEIRCEPKDLEHEFKSFWADCMLHKVKPRFAAIEKASTGITLLSILQDMRGLEIREVKRTKASGSKTQRFLEMQPYIASKLFSFTEGARHVERCIAHMTKITANNSHRHDDVCFVAGTKIATQFGYKNIEDIQIGDKVITPFGLGRVSACGETGEFEVIKKHGLIGTPGHPVFSNGEFKRLDALSDDDNLSFLSLQEMMRWRYQRLLNLMESNIDSWGRNAIISVNQNPVMEERVLKDFMSLFGNFIAGKKYRKAMLFTTRIITILIITLLTWSAYLVGNTLRATKKTALDGTIVTKAKSILKWFKSLLKLGIKAKKEGDGTLKMLKNALQKYFTKGARFAKNAEQNLFIKTRLDPVFVLAPVEQEVTGEISGALPQIAQCVTPSSRQKNNILHREIEKHAPESAPDHNRQKVYNLTVETYGVYYANNILVSNCDTFYDACKIALIDKLIYLGDDKAATKTIAQSMARDFNRKLKVIANSRTGSKW